MRRRGASPRDATPKIEHFPRTAADVHRRQAMARTSGRLVFASGVFAALFALAAARIAQVTVIAPAHAKVAVHHVPPEKLAPWRPIAETAQFGQRASIVDRNGQLLASSQPARSVFANPKFIVDPADAARRLRAILPRLDEAQTVWRLSRTSSQFEYILHKVTPDEETAINKLGLPGVDFKPTQLRHYPRGRAAAHVLGGVDFQENGTSGVEYRFNDRLKTNSESLRLSLDVRVQDIVRDELMSAIHAFSAIGGAGIVMDVNTGEILAMVSLPDYDANAKFDRDAPKAVQELWFNRPIQGLYEPGSTFKLQTASMALDAGLVHIWDSFDASHDMHFGRATISDFEGKHRVLTLPEVIAYSSNLGAAHIATIVGMERQRAWLRSMGMFDRVPVELTARGMPYAAAPGDVVTKTIGFGHGINVSPLHVVAGTAAIANGGVLLHPTILLRPRDGQPVEGARVMNPGTSDIMRRLMRLVVSSGFGKKADAAGFYVGGKTGTAEKNVGHGYLKNKNVSAFMSVFPMQSPRYAVYMMVDEPHGTAATGGYRTAGWVAAPAAGRVIAQIGPLLGVQPDTQDADAINKALAIPMQPPRGLTLGPIRAPSQDEADAPPPPRGVRPVVSAPPVGTLQGKPPSGVIPVAVRMPRGRGLGGHKAAAPPQGTPQGTPLGTPLGTPPVAPALGTPEGASRPVPPPVDLPRVAQSAASHPTGSPIGSPIGTPSRGPPERPTEPRAGALAVASH